MITAASSHPGMRQNASSPWRFSTRSEPKQRRAEAWRKVMGSLHLPISEIPDPDDFSGQITSLASPTGVRYTVVKARPQTLGGALQDRPSAIWLSLILKGAPTLITSHEAISLGSGDVVYGVTGGGKATLCYDQPFEQIFVNAPETLVTKRLLAPLSSDFGYFKADHGVRQVFSSVLRSVANGLEHMSSSELALLDQSLVEFLVTCALEGHAVSLAGQADRSQTDLLHAMCQTIELLLGDTRLSAQTVCDANGISKTHLRKSFADVGQTFSDYVRLRRLERARSDLLSPVFAHQSIAEISYRWGFKAPAYFSRVFRSMYGISPGALRRKGGPNTEASGA